ncbi:polysaccharide deacetylase family protein [Candidatus Methylopumilus universalis]|nr:polysaccharide deacetylase family protein [Candidatus Methylopumilus universalis]
MFPPVNGLRVLMYHAVGTPALGDELGLFSISPNLFKQHMTLLAGSQNVRVVRFEQASLDDLGCRVAITFDDGYLDNLDVAAPILSEIGIPFTVFVTSDFVRNRKAGFLSPEALRELGTFPGAQIGSHGASHVALTKCDESALNNELISSRHYLEDILGVEVRKLAYPFGAVDRHVRDAAFMAGYTLGACSFSGVNSLGRDPLLLRRTEISALDSGRVFRQKMHGDWDWYRWRSQDPIFL